MSRTSLVVRMLLMPLALAIPLLAGCGKSDAEQYKNIALGQKAFTAPIVLHLNSDGYAQSHVLENLHGVDARRYTSLTWSGGPDHFSGNFPGCIGTNSMSTPTPKGRQIALGARLNGYTFDGDILFNFLVNNEIIYVNQWTIRYSNLDYPQYGQVITWFCSVVNAAFIAQHFSATTDVHRGLNIAIGNRQLLKWTYTKTYEAPLPGAGQVTIFAGTFTYTIIPAVPVVEFASNGSGNVKMHLDPDTGNWVVDAFELSDPDARLLHATEPENPYRPLGIPVCKAC